MSLFENAHIIIGGKLNIYMDPKLDKMNEMSDRKNRI